MRQKQTIYFSWTGILVIVLAIFIACSPSKSTGKNPGKSKSTGKDSAVKKIDDGPSEFFQ